MRTRMIIRYSLKVMKLLLYISGTLLISETIQAIYQNKTELFSSGFHDDFDFEERQNLDYLISHNPNKVITKADNKRLFGEKNTKHGRNSRINDVNGTGVKYRDKRNIQVRTPCKLLYLDSKVHMPAEIASSLGNWFGLWVLDETLTFSGSPLYNHERLTELHLYRLNSNHWVIAQEKRETDDYRSLDGFKAVVTDPADFPEDIKEPITVVSSADALSQWPGLNLTCVSVEHTCLEIAVTGIGFASLPYAKFNGVYLKSGVDSNRPYYDHSSQLHTGIVFKNQKWAMSTFRLSRWSSGRRWSDFMTTSDFVFEPNDVRFEWSQTSNLDTSFSHYDISIQCIKEATEIVTPTLEAPILSYCPTLYLSGFYSSIQGNVDVIKVYGYYFLIPNITQNERPVYAHESNSAFMRFICIGETSSSWLWAISRSINITDRSYELSVLDTALSPETISGVSWRNGQQEIITQVSCDKDGRKHTNHDHMLILDNSTDNRFSYLRGLYNTTGDIINQRLVYQWMKPTLGYISKLSDLHVYYLSSSSEWVLGQGIEGENTTIVCRVTDPVLYPTNITRPWMCGDSITGLTNPEPFQFLYFVPEPEPTTQTIAVTSPNETTPHYSEPTTQTVTIKTANETTPTVSEPSNQAITITSPNKTTPHYPARAPCGMLYLDSKVHMPAEIASSPENWFGLWILDETLTVGGLPSYTHESLTELRLYKVNSNQWAFAHEKRKTDDYRSLGGFKAVVSDAADFPDDIKEPIMVVSSTGALKPWPGLKFTCVSVEVACEEIVVSGISYASNYARFNGIYLQSGVYSNRPYYDHTSQINTGIIFKSGRWAISTFRVSRRSSGRRWSDFMMMSDFVFEPNDVRFNWSQTFNLDPSFSHYDITIRCIKEATTQTSAITSPNGTILHFPVNGFILQEATTKTSVITSPNETTSHYSDLGDLMECLTNTGKC
ncbi:unnamed protein product [Owenia fusiformis]|uniref:Uncharacterized protein n=1 Tax=Owenia fusiformis TaxID=6347 RepID=A0A8S4NLG7_OWEFU|nr:unnamed protein product [Owenia fusiformis]